jgi:hypothetical protein
LDGSYRKTREKARNTCRFQQGGPAKKAPPVAEPDLRERARIARYQRPKNSHNRMITGIGTPNSQSRIPRPMFASFEFLNRKENTRADVEFLPPQRKTF